MTNLLRRVAFCIAFGAQWVGWILAFLPLCLGCLCEWACDNLEEQPDE